MKFHRAIYFVLSLPVFLAMSAIANAEIQNPAIKSVLSGQCKGTREVFYRSQKLTSPSRKSTYYFNVVLRRVSNIDKTLDAGNGSRICDPSIGLQTPVVDLMSDNGDSVDLDLNGNGFYLTPEPLSFSLNEKYLIAKISYVQGFDGGSTILIIDLKAGKMVPSDAGIEYCLHPSHQGTIADHMEFKGFVEPGRFLVDCAETGGEEWSEIVDLSSGYSVETAYSSSDSLQTYGNVTSPGKVVKEQDF